MTFGELWDSSSWQALLTTGVFLFTLVAYALTRIFFRIRTASLLDVILSLACAALLLYLVWKSWAQSLLIMAATILISEAWKDFVLWAYNLLKKLKENPEDGSKDNDNSV